MRKSLTTKTWLAMAAALAVGLLVLACSPEEERAPAKPTVTGAQPTAPGGAPGKQPLLYSVPDAPPRPTAAPPPPGATPAPKPNPPAPEKRAISFYVDTTTSGPGESKFNVDADRYCVISSVFRRGMHITWRMMAWDDAGKELQEADVSTAIVKLANGEELKFRFGPHGGPWFWTTAWDVPMDWPIGVLDYEVEVSTKDGKSGTFKPIAVSMPARGIESRLQIIE